MKICVIIICILCLGSCDDLSAQGIAPSTVRQVFSLEKGDSLEYNVWTVASGCGTICNWYELKVVDSVSYSNAQDSLFISFQIQLLLYDPSGAPVNPCGTCQEEFNFQDISPVTAEKWSVTDLDSSIVYFLDTAYGGVSEAWVTDSIYNNSLYNGSKQNLYNLGERDFSGTNEIYADSIGIVYKAETEELADNNREQLIYYHKTNGKEWGTPYIVSGLQSISKVNDLLVYPNPAESKFIIQSQFYTGMHFSLFDAISKRIMNISLHDNETVINRNNLPAGIYFWQISNGTEMIKTGKLVIE